MMPPGQEQFVQNRTALFFDNLRFIREVIYDKEGVKKFGLPAVLLSPNGRTVFRNESLDHGWVKLFEEGGLLLEVHAQFVLMYFRTGPQVEVSSSAVGEKT